jgi:hypothetical protein
MVNENKKSVFAAVAGVVVGVGAVIAGVVALSDKKNQKKVSEVIMKGKKLVSSYIERVTQVTDETEKTVGGKIITGEKAVKKAATKAIASAEKATKAAKRIIKKI